MNKNSIGQARPTSTFENFDASTDDRVRVRDLVKGLGEQIVAKSGQILKEQYPFAGAKLLILWGKSGRGKTHLIEAFINYLKVHAPNVLSKIYLSRENFTLTNIGCMDSYGDLPIVILDDLFVDYHDIDQLHPNTDIDRFMKFIQKIYEERRLVIITTNFPFKEGILEKVMKVDRVGRIVSRLAEILSHSGEVEVTGKDYRMKDSAPTEEAFCL